MHRYNKMKKLSKIISLKKKIYKIINKKHLKTQ